VFGRKISVFTSQGQAKRFFVDKVIAQAATEGQRLSEAERRMLSFSESDPEFVVDPALVEQLAAEISDEDYEAKVVGLVERSCERDVASDSAALESYREAYTALNQSDHYLLIMLQRGLSRRLRPWWAFWR
jgi:hypothetical protein